MYFRQGLEKSEPREFTVTEAFSENGQDYVRIDHPTCPEGAWLEKFFGVGPSEDNGRSGSVVPADPKPPRVDAGPSEKFYVSLDELLTLALGAWAQKDDATAVESVTRALEVLRNMRESASGAKQ